MRLAIAALAVLLSTSSVAGPAPSPAPALQVSTTSTKICANPAPRLTRGDGEEGKFSQRGDLPPGKLQLAVQREVDGCIEPVIVRHNLGAKPQVLDTAPRR